MEQIEVEIIGLVTTAQYGTLNTGTILRTSPEFAKHLVEDCGAAKYRGEAPASVAIVPTAAEVLRAVEQVEKRQVELDAVENRQRALADELRAGAEELEKKRAELEAERQRGIGAEEGHTTVPAPATLTKEQLQAALTAKGKEYPAAATKAELVALLAA